jgi:hypothetical protein
MDASAVTVETQPINFIPAQVAVTAVTGATLVFALGVTHADGSAYDLTGYTVEAPILPPRGELPPVEAFAVEMTGVGVLQLTLDPTQTAALGDLYHPMVWGWCIWVQLTDTRYDIVHGRLMLVPP